MLLPIRGGVIHQASLQLYSAREPQRRQENKFDSDKHHDAAITKDESNTRTGGKMHGLKCMSCGREVQWIVRLNETRVTGLRMSRRDT